MGNIEKMVAELHDIVGKQLTFHDVDSVKSLVENVKAKIIEIEEALVAKPEVETETTEKLSS